MLWFIVDNYLVTDGGSRSLKIKMFTFSKSVIHKTHLPDKKEEELVTIIKEHEGGGQRRQRVIGMTISYSLGKFEKLQGF